MTTTMEHAQHLQPVPEDWSCALALVAHPDDLEYGAAAAVARWTAQGKRIVYCLVTSGEAGIDTLPPEQAGPTREQEQRTAAAIVGVETVSFLGYPDGTLEYGLALRRDLARQIRLHRPDVVLTANFRDFWPRGGANQADHIVVGRATVDAVRDAANRWVFPELAASGLAAWPGVRAVLAMGSPAATHAVDVTDHFACGVQSLRAHAAYLRGLGTGPLADPERFLETMARGVGPALGCEYAVPFELVPVR